MTTQNDTPPPSAAPAAGRRSSRQGPWLAVAVAALALAGWQWFETRQKLNDLQQEVSRQLSDFDTGNKEERGAQKQTREQIEALQKGVDVGIATLIVDRDYRKVCAESDRLVVMQKGRLVLEGPSEALQGSAELAGYLGV